MGLSRELVGMAGAVVWVTVCVMVQAGNDDGENRLSLSSIQQGCIALEGSFSNSQTVCISSILKLSNRKLCFFRRRGFLAHISLTFQ